ncbi:MAG: hypothetical protein EPO51_07785 [Phenylobacterium sp.]|uniref:SCO4402 family protein n=1 Tax=Phenylobacterium sp. TaxID=1871053 RepID=UPI0011F88E3F|nr:hypothetical protein [Phenylobacterium sp.]TAJ72816.1 MAG: hypothetical protein EPO51_07785 [Phenylobacterium sp.]
MIHFLFDDHDFDETEVGECLLDKSEAALVQTVKRELDRIIQELPKGGDDEYVVHPNWPTVTAAAVAAHSAMSRR